MAGSSKKNGNKKSNSKTKTKKANSTKKTTAKKASPAKKAAMTKKRKAMMEAKRKKMRKEISIWVLLLFGLLLILSNFKLCGVIGAGLRTAMLGCFGTLGFIFPVLVFVIVGFLLYSFDNEELEEGIVPKILLSLGIYMDMCILAHLIAYGSTSVGLKEAFRVGAGGDACGGFLGALIGNIFTKFLGVVGAYLITIILLIICIVLVTGKTLTDFIDMVKDDSEDEEAIQEIRERKREQRRLERENRRLEREEQLRIREEKNRQRNAELKERRQRQANRTEIPLEGVNFGSTTLTESEENPQDVHEIKSPMDIPITGVDDVDEIKPDFTGVDNDPIVEEEAPIIINETPTISSEPTFDNPTVGGMTDDNDGMIEIINSSDTANNEEDDRALYGEFEPKERVYVSPAAKEAMKRKPYSTTPKSDEEITAKDLMEQEKVEQADKKLNNEGKVITPKKKKMVYRKPPMTLLNDGDGKGSGVTKSQLMETANKLREVLQTFGVKVEITNVSRGPSVTRYELQPEIGTKVSKITGLADDIKLNMAAKDIRIEAPIPGKAAVGIEIPNESRNTVYLKELLKSKELREHPSKLAFPAGKDISGKVVVGDIAKMPHMLIAGTTGSGKSVFTNSIIMSILYRTTPEEVRLIVIDPKVVEFQVYNNIPHLLYDVVTDPKKAAGVLNWAVAEMTTRYKKFANVKARDIKGYNAKVKAGELDDENAEVMPQILIVIDELADLMMVAAKEVEEAICRLAQLARAAGIHMIIATQRPSVDVITGLIKGNIPSRAALTVASGIDSRTIIDTNGAEKLLGNGDMLFYPAGYVKPVRLQSAFVSDQEVSDTVEYIKTHSGEAEYDETIEAKLSTDTEVMEEDGDRDPYFADAGRLCIEKQKGSTSMLQRQFRVGFNRAARIMEQLYDAGVVGQEESNKPRKIIMSMEQFEQMVSGKTEEE